MNHQPYFHMNQLIHIKIQALFYEKQKINKNRNLWQVLYP